MLGAFPGSNFGCGASTEPSREGKIDVADRPRLPGKAREVKGTDEFLRGKEK
jgi:hypothetical protein